MAILDTLDQVNSRTSLLPYEVCKQVVERIDAEPRTTNLRLAHEFVVRLLGCYPNLKAHDPKAYTASLVATFANFPPSAGRRVADPVNGLGAKLKFDPKVADVNAALEAELKRRQLIRANALWHNQEREERRRVAEAEREFQANRRSAAERKAQVDDLLRARPMQDPERPPEPKYIDKELLFACYEIDMAELEEKRRSKSAP